MTKQYFSTLLKRVGVSSLIGMAVLLLMVACPKPEDAKKKDNDNKAKEEIPKAAVFAHHSEKGFTVAWKDIEVAKKTGTGNLAAGDVAYKVYYTSIDTGVAAPDAAAIKAKGKAGKAATSPSKTAGVVEIGKGKPKTATVGDKAFVRKVYVVVEGYDPTDGGNSKLSGVMDYSIAKAGSGAAPSIALAEGDAVEKVKVTFTKPRAFGTGKAGTGVFEPAIKYYLYYAKSTPDIAGAKTDKDKIEEIIKAVGNVSVTAAAAKDAEITVTDKGKGAVELRKDNKDGVHVLKSLDIAAYYFFVRVVHPDSATTADMKKADKVGDFARDTMVKSKYPKSNATAPPATALGANPFSVNNHNKFTLTWTKSDLTTTKIKKAVSGDLGDTDVEYKVYYASLTTTPIGDAAAKAKAIKAAAELKANVTAKTAGTKTVTGPTETVTVTSKTFVGVLYIVIDAINKTDTRKVSTSGIKNYEITTAGEAASGVKPTIVVAAIGADGTGEVSITLTALVAGGAGTNKAQYGVKSNGVDATSADVVYWLYYSKTGTSNTVGKIVTEVELLNINILNVAALASGARSVDKSGALTSGAVLITPVKAGVYKFTGLTDATPYRFFVRQVRRDGVGYAPNKSKSGTFFKDSAIKTVTTKKAVVVRGPGVAAPAVEEVVPEGGDAKKVEEAVEAKVDAVAPTVEGVAFTGTPASGGAYKATEKIQVEVTFSEAVTVTNKPKIVIKVGDTDKDAMYESGSTTTKLLFEYTVVKGDTAGDGILIEENKLTLEGGTIKDAAGNDAVLIHIAMPIDSTREVDTTAPTVDGVAFKAGEAEKTVYKATEKIQVEVTFSEAVTVTGNPKLKVIVDAAEKDAEYKSGSTTTKLLFEYTVVKDDKDADGIAVKENSLEKSRGNIKDKAGNELVFSVNAAVAQDAKFKVDTTAPTVDGVAFKAGAVDKTEYKEGEKIQVEVTFSEAVDVTGNPKLSVIVGADDDKDAEYKSGSTTTKLLFEYTVKVGETDADGIAVKVDSLEKSGGSIKDKAGNELAYEVNAAVAQDANFKVDTTAPTVDGVAFKAGAVGKTVYKATEKIQVEVTFDEAVTVTNKPKIVIKVGDTDKDAEYKSGSTTTKLLFEYTVVKGDTAGDGILIEENKLTLERGTIKDAAGNDAVLVHDAVPIDSAREVDTTASTVEGVAFKGTPASGGAYKATEKIQVEVTFDEAVTVTNKPKIVIKVGDTDKDAEYKSGSTTTKLLFEYTVVKGDADTDGILIEENKLTLERGTIKDAAGNDAVLVHDAVPIDSTREVDTAVPTVEGVAFKAGEAEKTVYKATEKIQVEVTFSEAVDVTGNPKLKVTLTTGDEDATYTGYAQKEGADDETKLLFEYTVKVGETDADGIAVKVDSLEKSGGSIKDKAGNELAYEVNVAVGGDGNFKVDTAVPTISRWAFTSNPGRDKTYVLGDAIEVTLTFNEKVFVATDAGGKVPHVLLSIHSRHAKKHAKYTSGDGTTRLVFRYIVRKGDFDNNGIGFRRTRNLELNESTIKDEAGNALVNLVVPDIRGDNSSHKVNAGPAKDTGKGHEL